MRLAAVVFVAALLLALLVFGWAKDKPKTLAQMHVPAERPDRQTSLGSPSIDWLSSHRYLPRESEFYAAAAYPQLEYRHAPRDEWRRVRSPAKSPGYAVRTPGGTALELMS